MTVKVQVRYPRVDFKKTQDAIHEQMVAFTLASLKTWVLSTVDPIPVLTGAARASFLRLASLAQTTITINPIRESRIDLGVARSTSIIIADRGREYGWNWESDLAHIGIVEDRVGFIRAGEQSIKGLSPELPQPVTKATRD